MIKIYRKINKIIKIYKKINKIIKIYKKINKMKRLLQNKLKNYFKVLIYMIWNLIFICYINLILQIIYI